ncbi:MAG: M20/M25/M40 family metallo-hydrolase [bacterium]|nr:M20/M25/M40 family metallo-hydrolase [bacterium]
MIQEDRLLNEFLELVRIGSPSKKEGKISRLVAQKLKKLGAKVFFSTEGRSTFSGDEASKIAGSDGSNIVAKIYGNPDLPPLMLNAHLDTVGTDEVITPIVDNGVVRSDGTTILGADDKSGVAIILEVLKVLIEQNLSHPPIDVVFTISEEIGLLGVKNLDFSILDAKYGYSLDTEEISVITTAAPSCTKLFVKIYGVESHAGASPEHGISAIEVASQSISRMRLGKIDEETTANIGKIKGGTATNIVPGYTEVEGEVRSHSDDKLESQTKHMIQCFKDAVNKSGKVVDGNPIFARVEEEISHEFKRFYIPADAPVVQKVISAGKRIGLDIYIHKGGGGSDANVFNEHGIPTVVLGTGMQKVHTKDEFIKVSDLVLGAKLLLEILICES